jgi:hypothetical protein
MGKLIRPLPAVRKRHEITACHCCSHERIELLVSQNCKLYLFPESPNQPKTRSPCSRAHIPPMSDPYRLPLRLLTSLLLSTRPQKRLQYSTAVSFSSRILSHACPTRSPGGANYMHSVLNTFFQAPVNGGERKRRLQERIAGPHPLFHFLLVDDHHTTAERAGNKDPAQYLLTVEQMIENDCSFVSCRCA